MSKQLPIQKSVPGQWVQTEKASHEAWSALGVRNPKASALLHLLAARVGENNAIVVSHKVLASLLGVKSVSTIKAAIAALVEGLWVEVRQIGENGTVNAYVLNDRVVWNQSRNNLRYSLFSATIVVSEEEQPDREHLTRQEPIRHIPRLHSSERQLPTGDGLPPPSQPSFEGLEPDLPSRKF